MEEVEDFRGKGSRLADDSRTLEAEDKISILMGPAQQRLVIPADREGILPPAGHVTAFDPAPNKLTVISPAAITQFQKDGEDLVNASLEAEQG
jgi:hypothetical protein